jgi:steroid delta-isomerase-like uncharacterized protein
MSDANKTLVRHFIEEAFGKGNLGAVDQSIADDFVERTPMPGGPAPNKAGVKQMAQMLRAAFPDMTCEVQDAIAEGDKVAVRVVSKGTHTGDLMGIAPTNKPIEINEQHWVTVKNGKIAEHWGVEDNLGMMQQLGIVQMP